MTEFWLIRHATTDPMLHGISGRSDVELSEQGRLEARSLARRLAGCGARRLYTSPIRRAQQTAEALRAHLDCALTPLPAFAELDYGRWTGQSFSTLQTDHTWQHFNAFRSGTPIPDGEHMLEVQARSVRALLELSHAHPNERVLIVSHADVLRAVLMHFLGMPLDLFSRLTIGPTSINRLELWPEGGCVLCINDTSHLEAQDIP